MDFFMLPDKARDLIYRYIFTGAEMQLVGTLRPGSPCMYEGNAPGMAAVWMSQHQSFLLVSTDAYCDALGHYYRHCTVTIDNLTPSHARRIAGRGYFCKRVRSLFVERYDPLALVQLVSSMRRVRKLAIRLQTPILAELMLLPEDHVGIEWFEDNEKPPIEYLMSIRAELQDLEFKDGYAKDFPGVEITFSFEFKVAVQNDEQTPSIYVHVFFWDCIFNARTGEFIKNFVVKRVSPRATYVAAYEDQFSATAAILRTLP